jgi:cobalt-zinc-cadmium efflux system outer membrane protein
MRLPFVKGRNEIQRVAYSQPAESNPAELPLLTDSQLTLATLEQLTLENHPTLAQGRAQLDGARGNWLQVGLPPNPVVGYSGQQLGSAGLAEQQGVFVGQEFVTGGKRRLDRQIAAWKIQRAERKLQALRMRVLTDVRVAYYDVLIAQRRRELIVDLVRVSEHGVHLAEALFQGGEVSEADPLRALLEADKTEILLQNTINQYLESWRQLAAAVGRPDMTVQQLEGELTPQALKGSWQDVLQRMLTDNPEIAVAQAEVEAVRWGMRRACAEVVPNVDVEAVVQDDRATGSSNSNLQVTFPLPLLNRNQGGIRKARAEVVAAERALDRLALDLQVRLAAAYQRYQSAENQVQRYSKSDGIISNSRRTLDVLKAGYQAEEFGVLDLLTAQRNYVQTNLDYLNSLQQMSTSTMEIRGLLSSGSLSE